MPLNLLILPESTGALVMLTGAMLRTVCVAALHDVLQLRNDAAAPQEPRISRSGFSLFCNRPRRASKRLLLLDYDGTLIPQNNMNSAPSEELLSVLRALCADARNSVYIISGRRKAELGAWFATVVRIPLQGFVSSLTM